MIKELEEEFTLLVSLTECLRAKVLPSVTGKQEQQENLQESFTMMK